MTSQRVKKRPPTEIGTFSRMSAIPDLRWSSHTLVIEIAALIPISGRELDAIP